MLLFSVLTSTSRREISRPATVAADEKDEKKSATTKNERDKINFCVPFADNSVNQIHISHDLWFFWLEIFFLRAHVRDSHSLRFEKVATAKRNKPTFVEKSFNSRWNVKSFASNYDWLLHLRRAGISFIVLGDIIMSRLETRSLRNEKVFPWRNFIGWRVVTGGAWQLS